MKFVSKSRGELRAIAEEVLTSIKKGDKATVIAMDGDLGSGKTALSQEIGNLLGLEEPIQSPTFVIEKIYELKDQAWQHLIHIDTYRLESPDELLYLGWRDIVDDPKNLILIEWAERVRAIMPEYAYHIVFKHVDENTREIEVSTP
jgi:tRNA threonylcarbamoyladenosine biosynthesis protein TsaE